MGNSGKRILVAGAGGLIGGHLVKSLLAGGYSVRAVGRRSPNEWRQRFPEAENLQLDLSLKENCYRAAHGMDEVYNLAADIGGVAFIEKNKALCMLSVLVNTHLLMAARDAGVKKYFYSSSFAVAAADTKPASVLGDGHIWEKLFSEKMTQYFREDFGLETRIGRLQNIYGTHDVYEGGKERAPAAFCRKAILAKKEGRDAIEIWGNGTQRRSFLYVEDVVRGIRALMASDIREPVRIGSNEFVSISELADCVIEAAGGGLRKEYNLKGPSGTERKADEIQEIDPRLAWRPEVPLREGIARLYRWIEADMKAKGAI